VHATFRPHVVFFLTFILNSSSKLIALLCCHCTPTADSVHSVSCRSGRKSSNAPHLWPPRLSAEVEHHLLAFDSNMPRVFSGAGAGSPRRRNRWWSGGLGGHDCQAQFASAE
jgi:hypothetical protein